jgi:hypothetical protein
MKSYKFVVMEVQLHSSLTSALDVDGWAPSCSDFFTHWIGGWFGFGDNMRVTAKSTISTSAGNRTSVIYPIISHELLHFNVSGLNIGDLIFSHYFATWHRSLFGISLFNIVC